MGEIIAGGSGDGDNFNKGLPPGVEWSDEPWVPPPLPEEPVMKIHRELQSIDEITGMKRTLRENFIATGQATQYLIDIEAEAANKRVQLAIAKAEQASKPVIPPPPPLPPPPLPDWVYEYANR